jgi:hypothetical protein
MHEVMESCRDAQRTCALFAGSQSACRQWHSWRRSGAGRRRPRWRQVRVVACPAPASVQSACPIESFGSSTQWTRHVSLSQPCCSADDPAASVCCGKCLNHCPRDAPGGRGRAVVPAAQGGRGGRGGRGSSGSFNLQGFAGPSRCRKCAFGPVQLSPAAVAGHMANHLIDPRLACC